MKTVKHYAIFCGIIFVFLLSLTIADQSVFSLYAFPTIVAFSVLAYKLRLFDDAIIKNKVAALCVKGCFIVFIFIVLSILFVRVLFW